MRAIELDKSKAVMISFEELPELVFMNYKMSEIHLNANAEGLREERLLVIELVLSANNSYYAMLGAKYIPIVGFNNLQIEVRYAEEKLGNYNSTLTYSQNTIHKGLPTEYVETVLKAITDFFQVNEVPSGKIIFDSAAYCDIGSSPLMFRIATKALLRILLNKQYPVLDSDVEAICNEYLIERYNYKILN